VRDGFAVIANAPGATVRGAELALTARPVSPLTLAGAFAYQNARITRTDADLGATAGERLPGVPKFTATVNADYLLSEGALEPVIGATLRHVSDRMAGFNGSSHPQYHLPEYTAFDLRAGIKIGAVNAQFYVRNVFNEVAQLSSLYTQFGTARVAIMQPRTIGLSATTKF